MLLQRRSSCSCGSNIFFINLYISEVWPSGRLPLRSWGEPLVLYNGTTTENFHLDGTVLLYIVQVNRCDSGGAICGPPRRMSVWEPMWVDIFVGARIPFTVVAEESVLKSKENGRW